MKTAVLALAVLASASFSTVLLSDDFDDGVADGWIEIPTGAIYSVEAGRYCFYHSGSDTLVAVSGTADQFGGMSTPDYSCRANFVRITGGLLGIVVRGDPYQGTGYGLLHWDFLSLLLLVRWEGYSGWTVLDYGSQSVTPGQEYWMRLEVAGNIIGGKIWTGSVGDEPPSWDLTAVDDSYPDPGYFALFGLDATGTDPLDISFDDVEITDDVTVSLESTTWAGVKRAF